MPLIGTAGHVDHGKSTLVSSLTGRDPDRWDEEKRRGLTIDLGFAWATLPGGPEVSFVDVPGHERFLKNMLAGIEAIDAALFVVAADEGWMPQSEEHLAVLDLLDVRRGLVALTKVDLVSRELADLARQEISGKLEGSSLEGAPIVEVSATTGLGMDELAAGLSAMIAGHTSRDIGRPRLWVDRSFSAHGAGTVVTGSLLDGHLYTGQTVEVATSGLQTRVRALRSHEREMGNVGPGRRVAVNLAGVDRGQVSRGDLLARPGEWDPTQRALARVRLARYETEFRRRGAYQVHVGTAVRETRILALDGSAAVLAFDRPLPLAVGDRFIIRDTGRRRVVAGGRVLDPRPGSPHSAIASADGIDPDAEPDRVAQSLLEMRGLDTAARLSAHSSGGTPDAGIHAGGVIVSVSVFSNLKERALAHVAEDHRLHPLRPGMSIATLGERLKVAQAVTDLVIDNEDRLERRGPAVSVKGFEASMDPLARVAWERARDRLAGGLSVPRLSELGIDPELVHHLLRVGEIVRVGDEFAYLPEQIAQLKVIISELGAGFTVADFRDAAGLSRKYAVPILEWSDSQGLTSRDGDRRSAT